MNRAAVKGLLPWRPLVSGLVIATVMMACAFTIIVFAGIHLQNKALDACTNTPVQHGSTTTVRWTSVLPPRYVCAYERNGKRVELPSP
jgi:hypothetical protein